MEVVKMTLLVSSCQFHGETSQNPDCVYSCVVSVFLCQQEYFELKNVNEDPV